MPPPNQNLELCLSSKFTTLPPTKRSCPRPCTNSQTLSLVPSASHTSLASSQHLSAFSARSDCPLELQIHETTCGSSSLTALVSSTSAASKNRQLTSIIFVVGSSSFLWTSHKLRSFRLSTRNQSNSQYPAQDNHHKSNTLPPPKSKSGAQPQL